MECIGAAADPLVAREMIRNLNPDVITLDVEMPRMDGIDFLSKLMRLRPMPVVMVSTLTERGAEVTMRALELGAVDFVAKPKIGVADGLKQLAADITDKIRIAAKAPSARAGRSGTCRSQGPGGCHQAGCGRGRCTGAPVRPGPSPAWAACRPRRSSSSAPPPAAPKPPRRC
jgi:two-component system chemotaxis response regulator CheB